MSNKQFVEQYMKDTQEIVANIDVEKIDEAIEILFDAWKEDRQVFIMGNGGSASNATHFAADLAKTIKVGDHKGIRAIPLSDIIPLVSAQTNDQGWSELYTGQLQTYAQPGDIGIAFSVHGGSGGEKAGAWSQNILKGMQSIKDKGGKTIGFSGFDGGPLAKMADVGIVIPANSTPHVEGLHAVVFHTIVFGLIQRIADHTKAVSKGVTLRK